MLRSAAISAATGHEVFLKAELFQKTGSFKPRGMLEKLLGLPEATRRRGAITFSAGNAAQGLAYAGQVAGVPITVVMPETASPTKAEATRGYGGEVILHGTSADAYDRCMQIRDERDLVFVSSFDDLDLMRGHASLALEVVEDVPDVDAVVVGIGGGGLIGGTALGLEALGHGGRLFGVEPTGADAMTQSLAAGQPVRLERVATIADGLGAPFAGEHCLPLVRERVEEVALVSDEEIVDAMRMLLSRCKLMAEGAGAAAVAALLTGRLPIQPRSRVCCVVSGGNVDLGRLKALL